MGGTISYYAGYDSTPNAQNSPIEIVDAIDATDSNDSNDTPDLSDITDTSGYSYDCTSDIDDYCSDIEVVEVLNKTQQSQQRPITHSRLINPTSDILRAVNDIVKTSMHSTKSLPKSTTAARNNRAYIRRTKRNKGAKGKKRVINQPL